jgi:hypothetical protein
VLARSLAVASIRAAAIPPAIALPVSDTTGSVALARDGVDRVLRRAATVRLLLDA